MTGAETQEASSTLAQAVTISQLLDQLEPQMAKAFETLTHIAREGVVQGEGEIRRGVVAVNGAGLLAVISLLSQSLHAYTVRGAAALYLCGLLFGWVGWAQRVASSRMAYMAETTLSTIFLKVKSDPIALKPLTTVADLEQAVKTLHGLIDAWGAAMKKPGKSVPFWTMAGLWCFFLATLALVVDFEVSPRPTSSSASLPAHQSAIKN